MRVASIREAQHRLSAIMKEVEGGSEVAISRRGVVIGRIVPEKKRETLEWPDTMVRLRKRFPNGPPSGKPLSELVDEARGDR